MQSAHPRKVVGSWFGGCGCPGGHLRGRKTWTPQHGRTCHHAREGCRL